MKENEDRQENVTFANVVTHVLDEGELRRQDFGVLLVKKEQGNKTAGAR